MLECLSTKYLLFNSPIATNVRLIAEAIACTLYNYKESACQGTMFDEISGSNHVSKTHIEHWSNYLASTPRFAGLMTTNKVRYDRYYYRGANIV